MKKLLLLLTFIPVISISGFSQVNNAKAMFLYNFSRLIKWPDANSQNDFIFGVLGNQEVYNSLVTITTGKKVIEIRPNVSWGKGHALRKILNAGGRSRNRLVVCCGDDATDEDAFRLLPKDAVTVRVGRVHDSNARFYVRNVSDVYRFLEMIDRERRRAPETGRSRESRLCPVARYPCSFFFRLLWPVRRVVPHSERISAEVSKSRFTLRSIRSCGMRIRMET